MGEFRRFLGASVCGLLVVCLSTSAFAAGYRYDYKGPAYDPTQILDTTTYIGYPTSYYEELYLKSKRPYVRGFVTVGDDGSIGSYGFFDGVFEHDPNSSCVGGQDIDFRTNSNGQVESFFYYCDDDALGVLFSSDRNVISGNGFNGWGLGWQGIDEWSGPTPVPLPGTLSLLGCGLLGVGVLRRNRASAADRARSNA